MTREQYEATVKAIIDTTNNMLEYVKNTCDAIELVKAQNLQIESVTNEYLANK